MKIITKTVKADATTSIAVGTMDGCMYLECFDTKTGEQHWSYTDDKGQSKVYDIMYNGISSITVFGAYTSRNDSGWVGPYCWVFSIAGELFEGYTCL